jgi:predicted transcriptional regulator
VAERHELLDLVSQIVSAQVQSHAVLPDQLPKLIHDVYEALFTAARVAAEPPKPVPAVPVKSSVSPTHIACLDCGKQFSILKRHLMTDHKLTPEQYRERWNLLPSYPLVAPNYAKTRSALAKRFGLGRKDSVRPKKAGRATVRK